MSPIAPFAPAWAWSSSLPGKTRPSPPKPLPPAKAPNPDSGVETLLPQLTSVRDRGPRPNLTVAARNELVVIERSLPSERLDVFLRHKFPAVSRGAIQRLIEEGHIRVNGLQVKPTHAPRAGETVEVTCPEARPAEAQPEQIALDVLYEDEALLVLNKQPGLVVHPDAGHEEHTLVNALLHHCEGRLSGIGGVARPGIV